MASPNCSQLSSSPVVRLFILVDGDKIQVPSLPTALPGDLARHTHKRSLGVDVLRACRLEVGDDQPASGFSGGAASIQMQSEGQALGDCLLVLLQHLLLQAGSSNYQQVGASSSKFNSLQRVENSKS